MYFDPGMGSMVIQAMIAVLAVMGGYFAIVKTKLSSFFGHKKRVEEEETSDAKNISSEEEVPEDDG